VKLTTAGIALIVVILIVAFYDVQRTQPDIFTGEIMDSQCAALGSHMATMKAQGFLTPTQCVLYCAHYRNPPGKYVLYDAATKTTYPLNDQERVAPYITEKVRIMGGYDAASHTVTPKSITAEP